METKQKRYTPMTGDTRVIKVSLDEWEDIRRGLQLAVSVGMDLKAHSKGATITSSNVRKWQALLDRDGLAIDSVTDRLVDAVCSVYLTVPPGELMGKSRMQPCMEARQVAIYLLWREAGTSLTMRTFDISYASVRHSIRQVCDRMAVDSSFVLPHFDIQDLKKEIHLHNNQPSKNNADTQNI
jgi:chromosomal replication initiation ATPase DnaA